MRYERQPDTRRKNHAKTACDGEGGVNQTEFIVQDDRVFFIAESSPEPQAELANTIIALIRSFPDD